MARNVGSSVENNFTRGFITEATGLNFPENACTETDNCEFDETGRVSRRLGFDLEPAFSTQTLDRRTKAFSNYLWQDVSGDGTLSFEVVQVGPTLYFYEVATFALSGGLHADTIDLTDFSPSGAPDPDFNECQFATGNGDLFVVHPDLEAFYVTYDASSDQISATQIDIFVRDFIGDPTDTLDIDERPTSTYSALSDAHEYNLRNQGWTVTNLQAWDTARTDMPSNADRMWFFKDSSDAFDASVVDDVTPFIGNTPAPKGHYILDLYNQDRNTASGLSSVPTTSSGTKRASTVAFFAGRVFYSGVNAPEYLSRIYFTQIIEREDQYGQCYQANDPTVEELFDILPSDGGIVYRPEMGAVYKLFATENALMAHCSNGLFHIAGSTGIGFTANDYTVTKISSINAISASSFIDVQGYPTWWNSEGIHFLAPGTQASTGLAVNTITDQTIKEFYEEIPLASKRLARGAYDPVNKRIQWIYSSTVSGDITENYEFDKILTLNVSNGAFSPWSLNVTDTDIRMHGIAFIQATGGNTVAEEVVVGADTVVVGSDTVIVFSVSNPGISTPKFKYLVSTNEGGGDYDLTFAETWNTDYLDWVSYEDEGIDYDSYFVTGYKLHGEAQRKWQSNYIWVYTRNTEPSSFSIQGIWDYATSGDTGRWTSVQNIILDPSSYNYRAKKIKIRGHGKTLQYKINSITGSPFDIIGWSVFETSNQQI